MVVRGCEKTWRCRLLCKGGQAEEQCDGQCRKTRQTTQGNTSNAKLRFLILLCRPYFANFTLPGGGLSVNNLPCTHGELYLARQRPAVEGRVARMGARGARAKTPFRLRRKQYQIRAGAHRKCARSKSKNRRRPGAEKRKHLSQRHAMLAMQHRQAQAERCFQPRDAVRCALKLLLFLMRGVRRMVGGDAVDGAVQQAFDHGIAVRSCAQRRV